MSYNIDNDKTIYLPISYGEAMDKLSILDIKLNKIVDDRKKDVKKEYDAIYKNINKLFNDDIKFYYNILKSINESIWDMQDIFRKSINEQYKLELCNKIINENDRRFKVKSKINNILDSSLKEQKGYDEKKIFILTHLGLGDNITCSGMVRYFSTIYDEVLVVCKKKYYENIKLLYCDDKNIIPYSVIDDKYISPSCGFDLKSVINGYDVILTGCHLIDRPRSNEKIPFNFYADANISPQIFWDYFHIPDTKESKQLYGLLKQEYYIIHNKSSTGLCFIIESLEKYLHIDKNTILMLNFDYNIYDKSHKFYNLAEEFVYKKLIYYKDTIMHASKLFLTDSSIFCIAMHMEIDATECFIVNSRSGDYNYLYSDKYKFSKQLNKRIFKSLYL
jgi:hypothetical protein